MIRTYGNHVCETGDLAAGTDTSAATIEWGMSLLNNPSEPRKATAEIDALMGANRERLIEESDLSSFPYLQSIINETLHLSRPPSRTP